MNIISINTGGYKGVAYYVNDAVLNKVIKLIENEQLKMEKKEAKKALTEIVLEKAESNTAVAENSIAITESKVDNTPKNKSGTRVYKPTIEQIVRAYGKDKFIQECADATISEQELADRLGLKLRSLRYYLTHNNMTKAVAKNTNKAEKVEINPEVKAESIEKIEKIHKSRVGQTKIKEQTGIKNKKYSKGVLESIEKTVDVSSNTCFKCGYRNREDGACDYAIITGESRRGGVGKCFHFANVEELE